VAGEQRKLAAILAADVVGYRLRAQPHISRRSINAGQKHALLLLVGIETRGVGGVSRAWRRGACNGRDWRTDQRGGL